MVKKLLLVLIITLVVYPGSGCISRINSYRSNLHLKRWEELAHKRQYDEAEKVIENALAYNPENVKAWTALGDIYLITEGYREARYAYEEALRLDRNAFRAYSGLIAVELEESGYSEKTRERVASEIEPLRNRDDKSIERLIALYKVLEYLHEYEKEAVIAGEIMALSPDKKITSFLSANLYEEILSEKDVQKRLTMIEYFLKTFPFAKESYMARYLRLAIAQKDLKERDLLFKLGEEWIQKEPDGRRANFAVGYWYAEEGIALDRAILYINKALGLMANPDPADKPDYYPEKEWQQDLQTTMGAYYSALGLAYYKIGRKNMAEDAYRKGAQNLEYDKDLYYRLGNLLEEKGDLRGAMNAYVQTLKSGENAEAEEKLVKLLRSQLQDDSYHKVNALFQDEALHKYFAYREGITTFTDVTESAGLGGTDAVRIAWGDYNNDTYSDILLNGNTLFRNNKDGTFTHVTQDAGITPMPGANGGIWGDIDNDGLLDFYTFATGRDNTDRLWKNNGDETFTEITITAFTEPDKYPTEAAAWGDYDRDGFIDLYLANYEKPLYETIERGRCYPDHLFHNNGNSTFEEATAATGMALRENMCGRGVNWGDYDNDGDSDIYVSNYRLDPNLLWNNNGNGIFTNVAEKTGADGYETEGAYGHTIGSEWGDYDNDGDLDLFVSNLAHPRYIGYSDKSMLLENQGPPHYNFTDRFGSSGIRYEETSADPSLIDYDNDGLLDIYFTSTYKDKKSFLYKGHGNGTFTDATWLAGVRVDNGWGNAFADFDNDGDLDLAVGGREGLRLFRNDGNENHWLHVKTTGHESNHAAIGARVTIQGHPAFHMQIREIQGGKGSGSQHSLPAEFGLGKYNGPLDIEVRFPSGKIARLNNVTPDQLVVVDEPLTAN